MPTRILSLGLYKCVASNNIPPAASKRVELLVTCKYKQTFASILPSPRTSNDYLSFYHPLSPDISPAISADGEHCGRTRAGAGHTGMLCRCDARAVRAVGGRRQWHRHWQRHPPPSHRGGLGTTPQHSNPTQSFAANQECNEGRLWCLQMRGEE